MALNIAFGSLKSGMDSFLSWQLGSSTAGDMISIFLAFLVSFVIMELVRTLLIGKLKNLAKKSKSEFDDTLLDAVGKIGRPLYFLVAVYIALKFTQLDGTVSKILGYALLVGVTYYTVRVAQSVIDYFTRKEIKKRAKGEEEAQTASVVNLITSAVNAALWLFAVLFLLSNFGFDITSLVAGLGIGGLAIALALQSVFGDIFATISIYFDKPFKVGDFVIIGQDMGTVQHIGLKSTRIKTLQGQELIIPNREITNARINNYKRMDKRRVVFSIGVVYGTKKEKLEKIPDMIRKIIAKNTGAEVDRVHFKEFGPYSLNFEVVYYVLTGDYNKYMDTQQEINLAVKDTFEKEGIDMAFPTQTVILNKQ